MPISTIRYYERRGLLAPIGRTDSNYREYDLSCVQRARFIRAAQAARQAPVSAVPTLGRWDART